MPIGPGTHLGSYVVQDFIGQGAMGVVYRAYHPQLERSCAVKVLQGLATDGDSYSQFLLEAKAIAHMRHPNVLNVFDFGEFEGQPYMVVEFVEGGSLSARLKGSPLDHETALRFLRGIGDALDYAHSLGIVHRDVKPANVLLGPGDTPILADFGLVKLMRSNSIASMTGVTTGTPAYMAPEQVSGKHVGPAADLYSLAVVAFEMLTGSFPFNEDGVLEVLYAHVHKEPAAASTVNPGLGARTDAVLVRGLAKDPAARWETCNSMVTALEQTLRAAGPVTERTMVYEPPAPVPVATEPLVAKAGPAIAVIERPETKAAVSPSATVAVAMPQPNDRKRRRRTAEVVGAAALVLVLLIAGVCLFQATRPPTLDVSPHVATYGQHVAVTATHVPRNQAGEIHLESVLHTFAFRAADNGNVTFDLTVPNDVETGDHTVSICWSGSCHAQTKLRVVSGVAETSPLPSAAPSGSPTASPSPSGNPTSQPGSTPTPSSTPTSAPKASPSPTPTRAPSPTPTPSTNPCPTSSSSAVISYSPATVVAGVTSVTVSGSNFTPNKSVTVSYYFPSTASSPKQTKSATVSCAGAFSVKFTPGLTDIGTGKLVACDNASPQRCATKNISIAA